MAKLSQVHHITWRLRHLNETATVHCSEQNKLHLITQSLCLFLPVKIRAQMQGGADVIGCLYIGPFFLISDIVSVIDQSKLTLNQQNMWYVYQKANCLS